MEDIEIDHGLIELGLYATIEGGVDVELYDKYNENRLIITLSTHEMNIVKNFITDVLGGVV